MKDLSVVVYTMKGCPYCVDFKEMLTNEGIEFYDRDIDEFKEEYDIYSQITENDMIPALLIIESQGNKNESFLYVPDRDYMELTEAIDLIKKHRNKLGII
jgi:glutaredoxin